MDKGSLGWVVGLALIATLVAGGIHRWASSGESERVGVADREGLVSLSPAVTETLYAIGAGEQLVGRSERCDYPPAANRLPAVGDAWHPQLEALVQLRPKAIVMEQLGSFSGGELEAIAPAVTLPWLSLQDMLEGVRRLGELSDRREAAKALASRLRRRLSQRPASTAPRVLLALGPLSEGNGSVWFMRRNSLHGRALEAAGARNAVDRDVQGAASISFERLLELDPDGILVLDGARDASMSKLAPFMERFPMLKAVKRGAVGVLAGPDFLATGPRILGLVEQLSHRIQAFSPPRERQP